MGSNPILIYASLEKIAQVVRVLACHAKSREFDSRFSRILEWWLSGLKRWFAKSVYNIFISWVRIPSTLYNFTKYSTIGSASVLGTESYVFKSHYFDLKFKTGVISQWLE